MSDNTNNSTIADNTDDLDVQDVVDATDNSDKMSEEDIKVITVGIVSDAVNGDFASYAGANVTIKASVRKALKEGLNAAVRASDLDGARRYMQAEEGCKGQRATKTAEPVNHTDVVLNRAKALILAANALIRGNVTPKGLNPEDVDIKAIMDVEGVSDFLDFTDMVGDWDVSDNEGVTALAGQKVTKSSERVDIAAHVAEVVEGAESGKFFSVRAIARTSTESAPNGCPSDGAVAMRLFPQKGQSTLPDLLPVIPADAGDTYKGTTAPVKGLFVV